MNFFFQRTFFDSQRTSNICLEKIFPKRVLENDFENTSGLPPSSAEWISLVAPAFSAFPIAPMVSAGIVIFSCSRRFSEFPESPRARKIRQERGYGDARSKEVRKEVLEGGRCTEVRASGAQEPQ